jgi:hypothetical protein
MMNKAIRTAVLAALLIGVAATAPPVTEAAPAGNCTFYSDASHTTVVGRRGKDCCNNPVSQGTTSAFYVCGGCFVCVPPPPR